MLILFFLRAVNHACHPISTASFQNPKQVTMDASIETQATATEAIMTEVGFQAVSRWIAADDDGEAFVFRKFDRLAARNLLYLQARMLALEERINKIDGAAGSMDMLQVLRNWEMLVAKSEDSKVHIEAREKMKKQIDLHEELQKTIKEYRKLMGTNSPVRFEVYLRNFQADACDEWFWRADEALDLQSRIANFSGPSRRVLGAYRGWLESSNNLKGLSSRFLDDKQDLVALKKTENHDSLSELLRWLWPASASSLSRFSYRSSCCLALDLPINDAEHRASPLPTTRATSPASAKSPSRDGPTSSARWWRSRCSSGPSWGCTLWPTSRSSSS